MSIKLKELLFFLILTSSESKDHSKCPEKTNDMTFNRTYTGVIFDPNVLYDPLVHPLFEESDAKIIFEKIYSKFDQVGIILRPYLDINFIKNMVTDIAALNTNSTRMKLTILVDLNDFISASQLVELIELLITFTQPINSGTLEKILIKIDRTEPDMLKDIEKVSWFISNLRKKYKLGFKIGLNVSLKVCRLIYNTSIPLFYETLYISAPFELSRSIDIGSFIDQVKLCHDSLKSLKVPLGLQAILSGSNTRGISNYTKFTNVWKTIDKFATLMHLPTLITQAFDIPFKDLDEGQTGWWRIVPKAYNNSSQLIFEDKLCLKDRISGDELERVNLTWLKNDKVFENNNVGITLSLSSWVDIGLGRLLPDLIKPLEIIYSKFSTILLLISFYKPLELDRFVIVCADVKVDKKPLEILLLSWGNTVTLPGLVNLADSANTIVPGIVKWIILNKYQMTITENDGEFTIVPKDMHNISAEYNWGAIIDVKDCSKRVVKTLQRFSIDMILFSSLVSVKQIGVGAEMMAKRQKAMIDSCEKRVKEFVKVKFLIGWPTSEIADYFELIKFWEIMADWGNQSRVEIIFHSVFDSQFENYGWWENKIDNTTDRLLISKQESDLKYVLEMRSNKDKKVWENLAIVLTILLLLTGSIIVAARFERKTNHKFLTKTELDHFFEGGLEDLVQGAGYNQALELELSVFQINKSDILGSGEFGQVCTGIITQNGMSLRVAVKTANKSCIISLRGLLSEIKVLAYLGKHPNIIELIGAYTKEVKRNVVYIFLEICGLGSLQKYLRKSSNEMEKREDGLNEICNELISDMKRWALEIATGMEYIASKNVVHMDLATRNVLLTCDKTVKISDFGLSRRLYNYEMYVKTQQEPLPWRWMSPESLRRREFTEKSDVWAYGVTLWEIYSLGDNPYAGIAWSMNFVNVLDNGLRLPIPKYKKDHYSLMSQCWNAVPESRPTFSQIKLSLNSMI